MGFGKKPFLKSTRTRTVTRMKAEQDDARFADLTNPV